MHGFRQRTDRCRRYRPYTCRASSGLRPIRGRLLRNLCRRGFRKHRRGEMSAGRRNETRRTVPVSPQPGSALQGAPRNSHGLPSIPEPTSFNQTTLLHFGVARYAATGSPADNSNGPAGRYVPFRKSFGNICSPLKPACGLQLAGAAHVRVPALVQAGKPGGDGLLPGHDVIEGRVERGLHLFVAVAYRPRVGVRG